MPNENRSVIILDDDLQAPTLEKISESLVRKLGDDTSPEFRNVLNFCVERGTLAANSDLDDVAIHFNSSHFLTDLTNGGIEFFSREIQEEFANTLAAHREDSAIFSVLDSVFNQGWEVQRENARPADPTILRGYDLVVMDLMMGDENDSVAAASKYLRSVSANSDDSPPIFFLMSNREELEQNRKIVRQNAQVGMGLFILPKSRLLKSDGADYLRLVVKHMLDSKGDADFFREFCIDYEKHVQAAWNATREALWNVDFSYLQQVYANTLNENLFFGDHVLDLLGYHHKNSIEKSAVIRQKFDELSNLIKDKTEKAQSFSRESSRAMHELETARHCVGMPAIKKVEYAPNTQYAVRVKDNEVIKMLPFGAAVIKGLQLRDGVEGFIHITQECDLSRNVIKEKLSLVLLKVIFYSSKMGREHPGSIPIILPDGSHWCFVSDPKGLIAKPAKEVLGKLVRDNFHVIAKLRPDLTRQLRGDIFHKLSRIERFVETGHKILTVNMKIKIRKGKAATNSINFTYDSDGVQLDRELVVSEFSIEKNKTYHLFGEDNYDAALFIVNLLAQHDIDLQITVHDLEAMLRNSLPGQNKKVNLPNNSGASLRAELHMLPTKKFEEFDLDKSGVIICLLDSTA